MKKSDLRKLVKSVIKESLVEKYTDVEKTWADMMEDLSKSISKPIVQDDAGNYNICECEPHHVSIRPIVHDIFDCVYIKDGTDREKKLYIEFKDLKKWIKEKLDSNDLNYVDSAYDKSVENSKDKDGKAVEDEIVVDYDDGKKTKADVAKDMNKSEDDPTEPMRPIKDFKKMVDYPETKAKYTMPKLTPELKKLVVKYGKKRGRGRPRKN